ncbi:NAD(P)H-binding protein [Arthrobacter sp. AET 35A]|uniref:NAD(P)-dependent oxidoreductase n=1 Tax=Arthrobacter sp. AET 35A TaxID=2292643 RepID=UPI001780B592|nr:NAD-dependent epimerase/dehydratase family protein [Arthrobacter sp. AET 35A]
MRIALLGATGRTGKHVLTAALNHGHDVTVLVRDPTKIPGSDLTRIRTVVGDPSSPDSLKQVLSPAEVVISALGATDGQPYLHTRTACALVPLMIAGGPQRFIGISCSHVTWHGDRKNVRDGITSAFARVYRKDLVLDKSGEFPIWHFSKLNWTLVRPHTLTDEPASGRQLEHDPHRPPSNRSVARADLGAFLLQVASKNLHPREAPFVATATGAERSIPMGAKRSTVP